MDEEHETADRKKRSPERPFTATTKKNHNITRRLRDTSRGNSRERERGDSLMVLKLWAGYRGEGGSILKFPHKEYKVPAPDFPALRVIRLHWKRFVKFF